MKIADGSCSLLIVGKWNRYLLTPEWVGKNLFDETTVEVEFPINRPDLAPRYRTSDNILFLPAVHRVQFIAPEPYNQEVLNKICTYAKNLIGILNHTPISAFGVNYGFEVNVDEFDNLELFSLSDYDALVDSNYVIKSYEIKRQLEIDEKILNLAIAKIDDQILFDFNYHFEVTNDDDVSQLLNEDTMENLKAESLKMLDTVYSLTLDEGE